MVHETGDSKGREARCSAEYPDLDVLVFGHSHIPWDTTTATGLRLLNPGSPTDRRRQPHCTYMTATAEAGELGTSSCTGSRRGPVRRARSVIALLDRAGPRMGGDSATVLPEEG